MSALPLSKLIRFLLLAAGLIIVFSVVWTFVATYYSEFLTWVAGTNVSEQTLVQQSDGTIYFVHIEFFDNEWKPVKDALEASAIQFGLLLAVALVAATPGLKIWQRLLYSLLAITITFILQIISIIIMARTYNNILFIIVSDVVPPVLWAIFSFRYFFKRPAAAVEQASASPQEEK